MVKLTQTQIDKTRKYLGTEIRAIDKLKISDEAKIYLTGALSEGFKKGFEICSGEPFDIREVDVILGIDNELTKFRAKASKVEPGVRAKEDIERIARSFWRDLFCIILEFLNAKCNR